MEAMGMQPGGRLALSAMAPFNTGRSARWSGSFTSLWLRCSKLEHQRRCGLITTQGCKTQVAAPERADHQHKRQCFTKSRRGTHNLACISLQSSQNGRGRCDAAGGGTSVSRPAKGLSAGGLCCGGRDASGGTSRDSQSYQSELPLAGAEAGCLWLAPDRTSTF